MIYNLKLKVDIDPKSWKEILQKYRSENLILFNASKFKYN